MCPVRSTLEVSLAIAVSTIPHYHPSSRRDVSSGNWHLSPYRVPKLHAGRALGREGISRSFLHGLLTGWMIIELILLDSILVRLL